VYENVFKGGLDLASEEGKLLLEKRAQRFSLTQGERKLPPVVVESIDESDLNTLYARYLTKFNVSRTSIYLYFFSLQMTDVESSYDKQGYRMDSIHMRGTHEMSTDDVFNYFRHYKPDSLEWVNDVCCNVVWLKPIDAARALIGLSKLITGLAVPKSNKYEEVLLVDEQPTDVVEDLEQSMEGEAQDQENKAPVVRFRIEFFKCIVFAK
jgi:Nuclear cap-binding protein subunit 3